MLPIRSVYAAAALFLVLALLSASVHAQEKSPAAEANQSTPTIEQAVRDRQTSLELVRFAIAQNVASARVLRSKGQPAAGDQMLNSTIYLISKLRPIPDIDTERMVQAVKAELNPTTDPQPIISPGYDVIRARVLRSKEGFAELSLNRSHGLHNYMRGYAYRNGVFVDKFAIMLTDDWQTAGFTDYQKTLRPGDIVVFQRHRPAAGFHPANALIGKRAEIIINSLPIDMPSKYSLRVYEVDIDAFGWVKSVLLGDNELMPNLVRYPAKYIDSLSTDKENFLLDKLTGQLVIPSVLALRNGWRNELLLAQQRAEQAEAERQRVLAEIERRDREIRQRILEERQHDIAEHAKRHLVPGAGTTEWHPAPGYDWVDSDTLEVRWQPGKPHPTSLRLIAAAEEGQWENWVPNERLVINENRFERIAFDNPEKSQTWGEFLGGIWNDYLKPIAKPAAVIGLTYVGYKAITSINSAESSSYDDGDDLFAAKIRQQANEYNDRRAAELRQQEADRAQANQFLYGR